MRMSSLLIATALLGSSAWAQDEGSPYYLQLGLGAVFSEEADEVPGGTIGFDPGFSTGIAFGRTFGISERLDLEAEVETFYQYFTVDEDDIGAIASAVDDDAKTLAFMLNGGFDYRFTTQYSVYGSVGLGWAKEIDYAAWDSGNLTTTDDDGAAFQARLGFGYNFGGSYDMRLGYHYFKTDTIDVEDEITGSVDEIDVAQHSVEATFRWGL
jgi:opacity protein-like surface antigen